MSYELEGTLLKKFDTQQVSNTFQKREFVVETQEQYPQQVKLELVQDKCSLLDSYNEGDQIKVHFGLSGREWNGKYFTNLKAWKLEKAGAGVAVNNTGNTTGTGFDNFPPPSEEKANENPFSDDLPF